MGTSSGQSLVHFKKGWGHSSFMLISLLLGAMLLISVWSRMMLLLATVYASLYLVYVNIFGLLCTHIFPSKVLEQGGQLHLFINFFSIHRRHLGGLGEYEITDQKRSFHFLIFTVHLDVLHNKVYITIWTINSSKCLLLVWLLGFTCEDYIYC